jgi:phage protein D
LAVDAQNARRAELILVYEGADISRDIAPYLTSFSYTDNSADKSDDISITLEDRKGNWRDPWFPSKGAVIHATIVTHDWDGPNKTESLPCGTFEIDEIECSGPPTQVQIKAVSTAASKSMRQEKKTRGWENVKLSAIAGDIANANSLKLLWDSTDDPLFERRDQVETSDLEFLQHLCKSYGVSVKVSDEQLICYGEEDYEAKDAVASLSFGDKHIKTYRFRKKTRGTHKASKVKYHDAVKGEFYGADVEEEGEEDDEGLGEDLSSNQRAESLADAEAIAKSNLHEANKKETTGSISMMGDMRFVAGVNVQVSGWGKFDDKYFIEKATHSVSMGSGYATSLELRIGGPKKGKGEGKKLVYTGSDVYGKNSSEGGPPGDGTS